MSNTMSYVIKTLLIVIVTLFLIPSQIKSDKLSESEDFNAKDKDKIINTKILYDMDEDEDDEFEVEERSSIQKTQYHFEDLIMWKFRREVNNLLVKIESLDVVSSSSAFSLPSKDINKKIIKNEELYDEIESGSWPSMKKDKVKLYQLKEHSEDLILEIETFLESIDKFTELNDQLLTEYWSIKTRFMTTFKDDPKFGEFDPIVLEDDDSIRNPSWWLWKTETTIDDIEETIFNVKIRLRDLSFQLGEILEEHNDKLKKLLNDNNMMDPKDQQKVKQNENESESEDFDEEDPEQPEPGSIFMAEERIKKWENEKADMFLFRTELNEAYMNARAIVKLTQKKSAIASLSIGYIYDQVEKIAELEASLKEDQDKSKLGVLKEYLISIIDQIDKQLKRLPGINDLMKVDVLDKMKTLRSEFKTFQDDPELDWWVTRIEKIFKDIRMIAAETDDNVHMLIKEFTELKSDYEVKSLLYHEDLIDKLRVLKKDIQESEKELMAERKRKRVKILAAKIAQNKNETFKDKMKVPKKNLFTVHREEL